RAVANAKLTEFRRQSWRLAMLVRQGVVDKIAAVDRLYEIAIAHALVRALGEERVQAIIGEALSEVEFRPMPAEFAACVSTCGVTNPTSPPSSSIMSSVATGRSCSWRRPAPARPSLRRPSLPDAAVACWWSPTGVRS